MPLLDQLLSPIPGANPGGIEIRYEPVFDKIKEARREEDDIPQGDWQIERKLADWPLVVKLATETLEKKSKDLQIAAWLTEAKVRREGFVGLREGLDVLEGLLARFWDHVYPAIEDGDAEIRAAPLEWIATRLQDAISAVPVTRGGHSLRKYKECRVVPSEAEANDDSSKAELRRVAVQQGKLTPEEFEKSLEGTPKDWYKTLIADIQAALASLDRLDALSAERFGSVAPSYSPLRAAIADFERVARQFLKRKLEADPDVAEVPVATEVAVEPAVSPLGTAPSAPSAPATALSAEPTSRDDAARRIISAARYLRQTEPSNPASYLLLRGFRWGELRAGGSVVDPKLLEAPPTQTRTSLKRLLLDQDWRALIELCEGVMGTEQGRGWLDLQRYVLTACGSLGSEYDVVERAIVGELRSLLADLPDLVDMTLMDDTPAANAETRVWLKSRVLSTETPAPTTDLAAADTSRGNGRDEERPRDARALAMAEVRGGRPERAIQLLMNEVNREKTRRGRFLLQAELASIMVDAGHEAVALPILEELVSDIEAHKLEEWEAGGLVARPMSLLYRCLTKTDGDSHTRQQLYLRICRLDPLQAMSFAQS